MSCGLLAMINQGGKRICTGLTENYFTGILLIINSGYMENQIHQMYNSNKE